MVQIGTIEYEAKVSNVAEAQKNANDFAESNREMGESARNAGAASAFLGSMLGHTSDAEQEAADGAEQTDERFTLLGSTALALLGTLGSLALNFLGISSVAGTVTGALGSLYAWLSGLTLSGIVGSVTGAISSFVSWLAAASAGALAVAGAIGVVIGVIGIWILKVAGALGIMRDFATYVGNTFPDEVIAGFLTILSPIMAPLGALGAFIVGTLDGGFSEGFARAREALNVFKVAWNMTIDNAIALGENLSTWMSNRFPRSVQDAILVVTSIFAGGFATIGNFVAGYIQDGFDEGLRRARQTLMVFFGAWQRTFARVGNFASGVVNRVANAFRSGFSRVRSFVMGVINRIRSAINSLMGRIEDVRQAAADAADTARDVSPVGGPGGGASDEGAIGWTGLPVDVPFAQSGGRVGETGAAVIHKDEQILPPSTAQTLRSGGGMNGGNGGNGVNIESMNVTLSGDFDPSKVSRRDVEKFADRLVDAIGDKTNRRSGVR